MDSESSVLLLVPTVSVGTHIALGVQDNIMPLAQAVCIPINARQGTRALWNERKTDSCIPPYRAGSHARLSVLQTGFTLIELLVVITLLGVLAGAAVLGYEGVQEQGRDDVTRFQMAELRQALLRFRSDSGSRDFPGQGQYDCEEVADEAIANGRPTNWPAPPEVPTINNGTKADWITWCKHPANFWMLFIDPLGDGWDADRKRGWNGPYFQRRAETLNVDNTLQPEGTLNTGTNSPVNNVWPILDPFNSPYLLFDLGDGNQARLVSLGSDLIYDEKDAPDCKQVLGSDGKPLDYILCLLR